MGLCKDNAVNYLVLLGYSVVGSRRRPEPGGPIVKERGGHRAFKLRSSPTRGYGRYVRTPRGAHGGNCASPKLRICRLVGGYDVWDRLLLAQRVDSQRQVFDWCLAASGACAAAHTRRI